MSGHSKGFISPSASTPGVKEKFRLMRVFSCFRSYRSHAGTHGRDADDYGTLETTEDPCRFSDLNSDVLFPGRRRFVPILIGTHQTYERARARMSFPELRRD